MLTERINVRQIPGEGFRRWFTNESFDLIVWYSEESSQIARNKNLIGFQLCYDKTGQERALSWRINGRLTHESIDDGESPGNAKMSPILTDGGRFDHSITESFAKASRSIDPFVAELVQNKLIEYKSKLSASL